jgi:hypothetical protein
MWCVCVCVCVSCCLRQVCGQERSHPSRTTPVIRAFPAEWHHPVRAVAMVQQLIKHGKAMKTRKPPSVRHRTGTGVALAHSEALRGPCTGMVAEINPARKQCRASAPGSNPVTA